MPSRAQSPEPFRRSPTSVESQSKRVRTKRVAVHKQENLGPPRGKPAPYAAMSTGKSPARKRRPGRAPRSAGRKTANVYRERRVY